MVDMMTMQTTVLYIHQAKNDLYNKKWKLCLILQHLHCCNFLIGTKYSFIYHTRSYDIMKIRPICLTLGFNIHHSVAERSSLEFGVS